MFNKDIRLKTGEKVRWGGTEKSPEDTLTDITKLLLKHKCQKVGTMLSGEDIKIGFELDGLPFLVDVPKVYYNDRYQPKMGIRIVFRYLEIILDLTKSRAVSVHTLLLPMAQVRDPEDGQIKALGEVWIKNIAEGKRDPGKLLLE